MSEQSTQFVSSLLAGDAAEQHDSTALRALLDTLSHPAIAASSKPHASAFAESDFMQGFVIKTLTESGSKVFLNVHGTVHPLEVEVDALPLAVGEMHADADLQGEPCSVVDCLTTGGVLEACKGEDRTLKKQLIHAALASVTRKFKMALSPSYKLPKMRRKGPLRLAQFDAVLSPALGDASRSSEPMPPVAVRPTKQEPHLMAEVASSSRGLALRAGPLPSDANRGSLACTVRGQHVTLSCASSTRAVLEGTAALPVFVDAAAAVASLEGGDTCCVTLPYLPLDAALK
ncbi:hypothetical protein H632_c1551p0 [Helicosporidium sp. ATCC 50920]|nr:hypothetical protein H632_c1551p0 [Helicosporidium sp. ATCC 50920]|eukprot:KDD74123.1 hypothetical protein H632_c1551p0 [Helicosporidium sp. ATCC 50920]